MFTVTNPAQYDPALAVLADMFRDCKKGIMGSTQKDQARAEGQKLGTREGRLDGLAAILNERRAKRYSDMTHLPILIGHDLVHAYALFEKRYQADHQIEDRGERAKAENEMWEWIKTTLDKITFDEKLEEDLLKERKRAIKAGEVEPDESDLPWLDAELKEAMEFAEVAESLADAARRAKAKAAKVNDAGSTRPVVDKPA